MMKIKPTICCGAIHYESLREGSDGVLRNVLCCANCGCEAAKPVGGEEE